MITCDGKVCIDYGEHTDNKIRVLTPVSDKILEQKEVVDLMSSLIEFAYGCSRALEGIEFPGAAFEASQIIEKIMNVQEI